jgi:hypothetical protein
MAREDRAEGYRILLWIAAFAIAAVVILRATSDQEEDPGDDYARTPSGNGIPPSRAISDSAAREHEMPSSADLDSSAKEIKGVTIRSGIGTITGSVADKDKLPVPGIKVRLIFLDWEAHQPRPADTLELTSVSDEKGAFKFSDLPLGMYFAEAFTNGLGSFSHRMLTQANLNGKINFRLMDSWILSGRVVDSDGRPIPNAELLPSMWRRSGRARSVNRGESYYNNFTTDDEGLFAITRLGRIRNSFCW